MESLREHFQKLQGFLKLGDKETFNGIYVAWEPIKTRFGKNGYRFTLERADGSRLFWDTSNSKAVRQISDLLDKGMTRGTPIKIYREGIEKENTKYVIEEGLPF